MFFYINHGVVNVVMKWTKNCYYNGKVNVIKSDESGKKCFYQSLRRSESSRIQHLAVFEAAHSNSLFNLTVKEVAE